MIPRRRRIGLVLGVVVPLAIGGGTFACNLILGIGEDRFRFEPGAEGGVPKNCPEGVVPPPKPTSEDTGGSLRFVFAMSRIDLSGKDRSGRSVGFDLDGTCTCSPTDKSEHRGEPSCLPPDDASASTAGCDEDGGIDNGFVSSQLASIASSLGVSLDQPTQHAACGRKTVLVLLDRYNGEANDPEVSVSLIVSFGIKDKPAIERADAGACYPGSSGPPWPGPPHPAKMDGTDQWTYRSVDYNGKVPTKQISGWVSGYRLVFDRRASSDEVTDSLQFLVSDRILSIGSPVLSAALVPLDAAGRELRIDGDRIVGADGAPVVPTTFALRDGTVSGRVRAADLLATLGSFDIGGGGAVKSFLCNDPVLFAGATAAVCGATETMAVPDFDFKGQRCNAMSIAVAFDAVPAVLARVDNPRQSDPCGESFAPECP